MFGQQPKEPQTPQPQTTDSSLNLFSEEEELDEIKIAENAMTKSINDQPEVVNVVEKISGILSPYFIVLVGLFLYEDNFLIGVLLITIGILSLLKISWQDIADFIVKVKQFLGLGEN